MPLKQAPKRLRNSYIFTAMTYRVPFAVTEVFVFANGHSYPVCPRCNRSMDREYMRFCDRCGQRLGWKQFDYASIVRPP